MRNFAGQLMSVGLFSGLAGGHIQATQTAIEGYSNDKRIISLTQQITYM